MFSQAQKTAFVAALKADPKLGHGVLFPHRHELADCHAHAEAMGLFHSDAPRALVMAFRDFGKSTTTEEAVIIQALLGNVHNVLVLGESETRAADRIRAIKHELENNELIAALFGDPVGPTWGETRIILANGCCIQAHGRGQSLRGVKHLQWRPDLVILDDIEDEQSVSTAQARLVVMRWWTAVVRPAMAKHGRVRMLATPMADGPELEDKCLPLRLAATPDWVVGRFPVKHVDPVTGEWVATWEAKYNIKEIDDIEQEYRNAGRHSDFMREYMCEAQSEEQMLFPPTLIPAPSKVRLPGWRPVYAAIDPARTSKKGSDFTGWAVWSWENNKLVVWESGAERLTPDKIIDLAFDLHARWGLAALGVEEDGVNDFLLQPLRLATQERGALPFLPLRAPKGKRDFISQLRPYFLAGEVDLVGPTHARLRDQLATFGVRVSGKDDAPNALAYAIPMRGVPRYPLFGARHVALDPLVGQWAHWLAVAAKDDWLAAVLVAVRAPRTIIVADAIEQGDPRASLANICRDLGMHCRDYTLVAGPAYHARYDLTGLRHAASRVPARLHQSGEASQGRETITKLLNSPGDGPVHFQVAERAKWSLRAFAGGVGASETLFAPLGLLTEAIESLMAFYQHGDELDGSSNRRYSVTPQGRRYISADPNALVASPSASKSDWGKLRAQR